MLTTDSSTPAFIKWKLADLVQWAYEAHTRLQQQHDTIEQLRLDNQDLSNLLRKELIKERK